MKTPIEPPKFLRNAGYPGDVDDLLRRFFKSEMPDPWPEVRVPATPRPILEPARPRWTVRMHRHFALAAAILFSVFGYWYLQSSFPSTVNEIGPTFQKHLGHKERPRIEPLQPDVVPLGDGKNRAVITGHQTPGPHGPATKLLLEQIK